MQSTSQPVRQSLLNNAVFFRSSVKLCRNPAKRKVCSHRSRHASEVPPTQVQYRSDRNSAPYSQFRAGFRKLPSGWTQVKKTAHIPAKKDRIAQLAPSFFFPFTPELTNCAVPEPAHNMSLHCAQSHQFSSQPGNFSPKEQVFAIIADGDAARPAGRHTMCRFQKRASPCTFQKVDGAKRQSAGFAGISVVTHFSRIPMPLKKTEVCSDFSSSDATDQKRCI